MIPSASIVEKHFLKEKETRALKKMWVTQRHIVIVVGKGFVLSLIIITTLHYTMLAPAWFSMETHEWWYTDDLVCRLLELYFLNYDSLHEIN